MSEAMRCKEIVRGLLDPIKLELNADKTRLTSFEEGFSFLGVTFKDTKYWYQWYGKTVEGRDMGETFPLEVDGYP